MSLDLDQIYQGYVGFGDLSVALPTVIVESALAWWVSEGMNAAASWRPSFSVAPTDRAPIVLEAFDSDGTAHRELTLAAWDLRPAWRRDRKPAFNARLETAGEKPTFRDAFARRRALVPMSGYYEWAGPKGAKVPHYIHRADSVPLAAAGLWETRRIGDRWETSFAVITRPGLGEAGRIHDRMPAFLPADVWDEWLSPVEVMDATSLTTMVQDASGRVAPELRTHRVDARLNSAMRVDPVDPTLVEPVRSHESAVVQTVLAL